MVSTSGRTRRRNSLPALELLDPANEAKYGALDAKDKERKIEETLAEIEKKEKELGDLVLIEECRPIAKTKAWRVTKLVEKAGAV